MNLRRIFWWQGGNEAPHTTESMSREKARAKERKLDADPSVSKVEVKDSFGGDPAECPTGGNESR